MHAETVELVEDHDGNLVLPLSDAALAAVGWNEGDTITWTDNGDGSFLLKKKVPELVMVQVETVQVVRNRYYVFAPVDHPEYALEDVVCHEVAPRSKKYLNEFIVSHRVVAFDDPIGDDGGQSDE